jgi:hypothetical protein
VQLRLHRLRQGRVLGGEHAAQAHPLVAQDGLVERGVALQLLTRLAGLTVDCVESLNETSPVALDQRAPENCLRPEVVVKACFGDAELCGNIRMAESL